MALPIEPPLHRCTVRGDWVDYNGHLRDAFYLLIFSEATDALMDHIGLDAAERERSQASIFTLECHLNFLREVKGGAEVQVSTQLIGHDAKRLHVHQSMHVAGEPEPACVCEQMLMHVDMRGPKSAPMAPEVLARVQAIATAQAGLPRPVHLGRVMRLPGA